MIGKRPIDLHLYALKSLGAIISEKNGKIQADCKKLKGQEINFPDRSVGATEQALLAAVLAEGETVLRNCAREPADFCKRWEHGSVMRKKGASGFRE